MKKKTVVDWILEIIGFVVGVTVGFLVMFLVLGDVKRIGDFVRIYIMFAKAGLLIGGIVVLEIVLMNIISAAFGDGEE